MAFEEGTHTFTCKACGTVHKARWSRSIVREHSRIDCLHCRTPLYDGRSIHDYYEVALA